VDPINVSGFGLFPVTVIVISEGSRPIIKYAHTASSFGSPSTETQFSLF
jgi:hypothetical protein